MPQWSSAQYLKFEQERTQPAIDLAQKIPLDNAAKVLDVGCGPGNSTAILQQRFTNARILGIDSSEQMIARAQKDYPQLSFAICDVTAPNASLEGEYDVVYSNACLQWIPDHHTLLPHLLGLLASGGALAVQVPLSAKQPVHQIIRQLACTGKWQKWLSDISRSNTLAPEEYHDILAQNTAQFTLWETTYMHRMTSHTAILEWYKGTGMRPFLQALPAELVPEFEQEVFAQIKEIYPTQTNGEVVFRFPRLFFTAIV